MRIFVDENIPLGREAFEPYGEVIRFAGRKLQKSDLGDCQALIVRSITKVNSELLQGTPVRFVGTATIGTDHVDQAWLKEQGIAFASAPGCNANSVGEYVTAALLDLQAHDGLKLEGATLGIVGFGHVGKRVKAKAAAMGLRVLLCDPPLQEAGYPETFDDLQTLLRECDILSLHVPLTDALPAKGGAPGTDSQTNNRHPTRHLLNRRLLADIAKPLTLLNTCRGEVVEAEALIEGKRSGKIARLVLDVFPGEPNPPREVWELCDLLTPHIAGYSLQGKLGGTTQVMAAFCQAFGFASPHSLPEPNPEKPEIDLELIQGSAEALTRWDVLRFAVEKAYTIRDDDTRLRAALKGENPGQNFDLLRRDYPIRHEFKKYSLKRIPPFMPGLQAFLHAFEFEIV